MPPVALLHAGGSDVDAAYAAGGEPAARAAAPGIVSRCESAAVLRITQTHFTACVRDTTQWPQSGSSL